ncbi:MAG: hypothetical protein LBR41_02025 [Rickettsiales bacterium]|jgi:hypothetical protein|nr:hypothetical protein [Rickettsiales bacterium]
MEKSNMGFFDRYRAEHPERIVALGLTERDTEEYNREIRSMRAEYALKHWLSLLGAGSSFVGRRK